MSCGTNRWNARFFFYAGTAEPGLQAKNNNECKTRSASVMAVATANFDSWLNSKLQELKTDESIFSVYIKGILEDCETEDEKAEALEAILAGITEDNIKKHVTEILEAWAKWGHEDEVTVNEEPKEDVDVRLVRMLESQSLPTTSHKSHYTEEEKRIREAILAQYSEMSDGEVSEGEEHEDIGGGGGGGVVGSDLGLEKNTNVANIIQAGKEKRERAKQESQKKKEKDKEDREKQKQLKDEKKEKRKTVKGERRR